jgi:hypothetical protein
MVNFRQTIYSNEYKENSSFDKIFFTKFSLVKWSPRCAELIRTALNPFFPEACP